MSLRLTYLFAAILAGLALTGCRTGPEFAPRPEALPPGSTHTLTNGIDSDLLEPADDWFTLGPGDLIEVELLDDPTTRSEITVGPDGRIYFHILPGMDVWGLTLSETKAKLEAEMSPYIVGRPDISVALRAVNSKAVWMLGRVNEPGIYPMRAPMTLLGALAAAGGAAVSTSTLNTLEMADLRHSFVVRNGEMLPVDFHALLREGDMSQNIYLKPDDFVFVPSALSQEVYVLGGVRAPRAVPYADQLSLVSAMAAAGGAQEEAFIWQVAIIRGSLSQPTIAVVDYYAIIKGRAPDVRLEPRDIVFVPLTPWRELRRLMESATRTFVSTIAANEGSRWVDPGASSVGISANPGGVVGPGTSVGGGGN